MPKKKGGKAKKAAASKAANRKAAATTPAPAPEPADPGTKDGVRAHRHRRCQLACRAKLTLSHVQPDLFWPCRAGCAGDGSRELGQHHRGVCLFT
jgi:hypothetical protein|eukprot:COSAG01_NODE_6735_length_3523_cov_21.917932_3_plen_95_part_00